MAYSLRDIIKLPCKLLSHREQFWRDHIKSYCNGDSQLLADNLAHFNKYLTMNCTFPYSYSSHINIAKLTSLCIIHVQKSMQKCIPPPCFTCFTECNLSRELLGFSYRDLDTHFQSVVNRMDLCFHRVT